LVNYFFDFGLFFFANTAVQIATLRKVSQGAEREEAQDSKDAISESESN
jgi:hypothetical protein